MYTCLFTGEQLDESTQAEHTIPESMCGRIESHSVSSSAFNNKCSRIDRELAASFAPFVSALGPLLSTRHRAGAIDVAVNGDEKYIVESGGILSQTKVEFSYDEAGRPTSIVGPDQAVRQLAKRNRWVISGTHDVPGATSMIADLSIPLIRQEIEVAVLKSVLLTFDHVLGDDEGRITRRDVCEPVRAALCNIIMKDGSGLTDFSRQYPRGICPSLAPQIAALFTSEMAHRFAHVMVLAGNANSAMLNCAWSVFGFEPHVFHLSSRWYGEDFTLALCAPVLRHATQPRLIRLPQAFRIRGISSAKSVDANNAADELSVIAKMRAQAISEARLLALQEEHDHVVQQVEMHRLTLSASGKPASTLDAIIELLQTLYNVQRLRYGRGNEIDRYIERARCDAPPDLDTPATTVAFFQEVLSTLIRQIGNPHFEHACTLELERVPARN